MKLKKILIILFLCLATTNSYGQEAQFSYEDYKEFIESKLDKLQPDSVKIYIDNNKLVMEMSNADIIYDKVIIDLKLLEKVEHILVNSHGGTIGGHLFLYFRFFCINDSGITRIRRGSEKVNATDFAIPIERNDDNRQDVNNVLFAFKQLAKIATEKRQNRN